MRSYLTLSKCDELLKMLADYKTRHFRRGSFWLWEVYNNQMLALEFLMETKRFNGVVEVNSLPWLKIYV